MAIVLLVEDELWLGELYVRSLERSGLQVQWRHDAYDAIDCIDEQLPDAIVLDLMLPWANGIGLLQTLASHSDLAAIPVIICSNALPEGISWRQLQPYGVVAALDKAAIRPSQLVATVREVLNAKSAN